MKRLKLFTLLLLCLCFFAGCKKANVSLTTGDVKVNTILVKENGSVQSAIVEDFDKSYYNEDELKTYIDTMIAEYNQLKGKDTIKLDSLKIENKVARVVLTYKTVDEYMAFNEVDAKFMTVKEAESQGLLPVTFLSAKDSKEIDKSTVLKNSNYKVIVLNEEYNVIVDGKIKYYVGAVPLNSTTVQTTGKETSVVIFKP